MEGLKHLNVRVDLDVNIGMKVPGPFEECRTGNVNTSGLGPNLRGRYVIPVVG